MISFGRKGGTERGRRASTDGSSAGNGARRMGFPGARPILVFAFLVVPFTVSLSSCATVTREDEIRMGRDFAEQINAELPLMEEAEVVEPIRELGHSMAAISQRPDMPYEFQVVNTDVVNAFAVPGGFIYMNRGLLEEAESMAEVAGVMGHEVAHVVARHSARQLERMQRAGLVVGLGTLVLGEPGGLAAAGINVGAGMYFARHSRAAETEADSLAVGYLVETGWHPEGLVDFMHKLLALRERKPGALESLFASHPLTEDRIEDLERIISRVPQERLEGLRRTSPEFERMLQLLAELPPPPEEFRVQDPDENRSDGERGSGEESGEVATASTGPPPR